jgi:hypothetical protein
LAEDRHIAGRPVVPGGINARGTAIACHRRWT